MSVEITGDIPKTRETILKVATKFNIYFMLAMALLGSILAIVGILQMNAAGKEALKGIPDYAVLLVCGIVDFSLFFPFYLALYFARHLLIALERVEEENRQLIHRVKSLEDGDTPLHSAARQGRVELASLLIARGADINARNNSGKTALQLAIEEKQDAIAELLRKAGAKE